jgi:hypothetical protein
MTRWMIETAAEQDGDCHNADAWWKNTPKRKRALPSRREGLLFLRFALVGGLPFGGERPNDYVVKMSNPHFVCITTFNNLVCKKFP